MTKKSSSSNTSGGVGLLGLLGILFVGLKLTGYIDWSWWYVTMPFWGGLAVVAAVMLLILIGWLLSMALNSKR
ncbi:hypothetical protein IQK56_25730 [Pseudomonas sp. MAFF 301449]|uniref:Uncharacterized protein n=1 Tax=Pseudomonas cyclaminis TaxID=2781239 RepID=A0ABR9SYN6_9PSED|nr:hypothetical protein [Pseudomonas cyclaminis]MBE8594041.1 hypothetical protein [Pseudomonas cyclaminis]MBE8598519.1 hypothetical protein [Pseudomonas cyclaminis]